MQWWVLNQLLAAAVALALRATFNQNPHLCVDRALVNIKVVLTRNHRSHCSVLHPRFMIGEQTARHWARDAWARCDSTPAGERVTSPPHPALTTRRAGPLTSSCDWVLMVVSRRSVASPKKKSSVGSFRRQNCFRLAASLKLRETGGSCLLRVIEKPSVRCVLHKKHNSDSRTQIKVPKLWGFSGKFVVSLRDSALPLHCNESGELFTQHYFQ